MCEFLCESEAAISVLVMSLHVVNQSQSKALISGTAADDLHWRMGKRGLARAGLIQAHADQAHADQGRHSHA